MDINSKPNISMLTPPKFANDLASGIKNSSKGHIIESDSTICRKGPGPTHTNRAIETWVEREREQKGISGESSAFW